MSKVDDLVGREAVKKWLERWDGYIDMDIIKRMQYRVIDIPPTQPGRTIGEWIRNDNGTYSCSVCQSWIPEEQHNYARYCLYCGAYMR